MIKKCKVCGKEFEPHHNSQKYCSVECRREVEKARSREFTKKYYRKVVKPKTQKIKYCVVCGLPIDPSSLRKKTCSYECGDILNKRKQKNPQINAVKKESELDKMIRDMNLYNKAHGTRLSYGQYVRLVEGT